MAARLAYSVPVAFHLDREPASLLLFARTPTDARGMCALRGLYLSAEAQAGAPKALRVHVTRGAVAAKITGTPTALAPLAATTQPAHCSAYTITDARWRLKQEGDALPPFTWSVGSSGQVLFPGERGAIEAWNGEALRVAFSLPDAAESDRVLLTGFALVEA